METSLEINDMFKWYNHNYTYDEDLPYTPIDNITWQIKSKIQRRVNIIEDFIGNNLTMQELAAKYNTNTTYISYVLSLYFKKQDFNLRLMSKI